MAGARDVLRFHRALLRMNVRTALAARASFAMQVGLMVLNDVLWFSVWILFFARYGSIGGFRLADMALLNGILACAFGLSVLVGAGMRQLARTISDGELDTFLAQPKPVLAHLVARRMDVSGLGDVVFAIGLLVTYADLDATSALLVPVAVLVAAVVFVSFHVLVHSVAFWAGPFQTFARQAVESLVSVSGYPDLLFGGALRTALFVVLPVGLTTWLPAELVRSPGWPTLAYALGGAIAFAVAAAVVFRAGLRRYESGSRFGAIT